LRRKFGGCAHKLIDDLEPLPWSFADIARRILTMLNAELINFDGISICYVMTARNCRRASCRSDDVAPWRD